MGRIGYKQWHRKDSSGFTPKVMPTYVVRINADRIGIYSEGDMLSIRQDESLDGLTISQHWIITP